MCDSDSWDFSREADTTEAEARKWIHTNRMIASYERKHSVKETAPLLVLKIIDDKSQINGPNPDWPEELKPYREKVDNILEAYFCHKFGLSGE